LRDKFNADIELALGPSVKDGDFIDNESDETPQYEPYEDDTDGIETERPEADDFLMTMRLTSTLMLRSCCYVVMR
jgi:hypothetical protein